MKEAAAAHRRRMAARRLAATRRADGSGALSLDGLITHRAAASDAGTAYATAFTDPACLKMILDWSAAA
jgi:bacteriochlorophyllide a dehydrogenase